MIVAVVMVLQRLEGCSDLEAVDRFAFDVRREYAARRGGVRLPGFRAHRALPSSVDPAAGDLVAVA
ncbi:MAG: hypothetical protein ACXVHC_05680 [Frankiaceae bacterium]